MKSHENLPIPPGEMKKMLPVWTTVLVSPIILLSGLLIFLPEPVFAAEWYVNLSVRTLDTTRQDPNNVLGRLDDSLDGYDGSPGHDIEELPPEPDKMATYLSIVFPHPDWNTTYDDFSSDFRQSVADETVGDDWGFDVRAGIPESGSLSVKIEWENGNINTLDILSRSRLLDGSGAVLVEDCGAVTSYTLNLTSESHGLIWQYMGQLPRPRPRIMPWLNLLL